MSNCDFIKAGDLVRYRRSEEHKTILVVFHVHRVDGKRCNLALLRQDNLMDATVRSIDKEWLEKVVLSFGGPVGCG